MAYTSIIPVHRLDNSVDYVLDEKKASRSQNADSLQAAVDYAPGGSPAPLFPCATSS